LVYGQDVDEKKNFVNLIAKAERAQSFVHKITRRKFTGPKRAHSSKQPAADVELKAIGERQVAAFERASVCFPLGVSATLHSLNLMSCHCPMCRT
jgi:hypothetical protein